MTRLDHQLQALGLPSMAYNEDVTDSFAGRVPPQNLEAERAVLGAMLVNEDAFHDMLELLEADQFYAPSHRKIFNALRQVQPQGKPGDAVIIMETLKENGELEAVGGATYLGDLTTDVPSVRNVAHWGSIVKNQFQLRELCRTTSLLTEEIFNGCSVEEAYEKAESDIQKLADGRLQSTGENFSDMLDRAFEDFNQRLHGETEEEGLIPPWPSLRRYIQAFRGGEMIVIAARPSMGKTSFALNLMIDIATHQQAPTIMFSLEMQAIQITNNLLCIDAGMDGTKWKKPNETLSEKEQKNIFHSVERLRKAKIFIDDDPELKPSALRAKLRRMKREHGLGAIIIDYIGLMKDDPGNLSKQDGRTQEISNISRQLKALAKDFDVPLFALAQLNRSVESRSEKIPRMSDLRESGSIEQDADVVALINRPEYYSIDQNNPIRPGEADIIVAKNRHGDVGTAELIFVKKMMTFREKDSSD